MKCQNNRENVHIAKVNMKDFVKIKAIWIMRAIYVLGKIAI